MKKYKTEFKTGLMNWLISPFAWSKWADILTFSFGGSAYLLQGKVNRRTNAKMFRVTELKQRMATAVPSQISIEKLAESGLINTKVTYP